MKKYSGSSRKDIDYALPADIIEEFELARYGAHGSSYGYIMGRVKELGILADKMVVLALGG